MCVMNTMVVEMEYKNLFEQCEDKIIVNGREYQCRFYKGHNGEHYFYNQNLELTWKVKI